MEILGKIPEKLAVAVSGGVDSMVLLDFLVKGRRDITILHYNHGTPHGDEAYEFVKDLAEGLNVRFESERLEEDVPQGRSAEDFWREKRYAFIDRIADNRRLPVALGHHLDDVVETWLFSSFNGTPKLLPFDRRLCFRPLLMVKKSQIMEWASKHSVPYVEDPSNENVGFMRNKIRHDIMPHVLKVNPGIHKTLAKMVRSKYTD